MKQQPIGRRTTASLLALLVLAATLGPPLLDAREDYRGAQVESEHDPATCGVLHDHTACTQLAKSFSRHAASGLATARAHRTNRGARIPDASARTLRSHTPTPSPRAPPARST